MKQLHKRFTNEQVKDLMQRYVLLCNGLDNVRHICEIRASGEIPWLEQKSFFQHTLVTPSLNGCKDWPKYKCSFKSKTAISFINILIAISYKKYFLNVGTVLIY